MLRTTGSRLVRAGRREVRRGLSGIHGNTSKPHQDLVRTATCLLTCEGLIDPAFLDRLHYYLPGWRYRIRAEIVYRPLWSCFRLPCEARRFASRPSCGQLGRKVRERRRFTSSSGDVRAFVSKREKGTGGEERLDRSESSRRVTRPFDAQ